MVVIYRLLAVLLCGALVLTACSPSSDKSSDRKSSEIQKAPQGQLPQDQYDTLPVAQSTEVGEKIEVVEFFAYFCSHCKAMDSQFEVWARKNADKVVFKRVPVAFRESMAVQQRMHFALSAMGKLEEMHPKIFHAVQEEKADISSDQEVFDFIARHGIDRTRFKEVYASFGVQSQARNAALLQKAYKIDSVPVVAIDGRFMTSASHASHRPGVETTEDAYRATMEVMSDLVEKVRQDRAKAANGVQKK